MGKKRKAGGRPAQKEDAPMRTKFSIEERFEDSEDEFQAGRDQVLLEEAPEAKRRRRVAEDEELLQPSDEEILGYDSVDEDDDELDDEEDNNEDDDEDDMGKPKKGRGAESDEDEEGIAAWGSSKKDLYNADQIETEIDALEEEQEAKRLQQKQLQAMNEADFGFDESEWMETGKGADDEAEDAGVVTEVLPQVEITEDMDDDEKRRILSSRYPEFEPLAKEFANLEPVYKDLQTAASKASSTLNEASNDPQPAPVAVVKLRALSTYLGTISLYFMLLASSSDGTDNPLWEMVKDLEVPEIIEAVHKPVKTAKTESTKTEKQPKKIKEVKEAPQKNKLSRAERAAETARVEAEARRAERLRQTEADLADLDDLVTAPTQKRKVKKTKTSSKDEDESDFGDENALTAREAEEKAKQKRSLRFYTSQLAQKSNKRHNAGRDAGGDADIPHRERLKDRQARLNAEAEKRGRQRPDVGQELGGDSDEEDHRVRKELRKGDNQSGSDEDEYYDMVAARSKQRKDDKQARAEAHAAAAREGGYVQVQEAVGADGKRAITYQIEKNKGLTPKRNKDVRNPRVKKRKKYEEKKKKLGSIRQIYKGGEGRGGYGGELTGIKKNLVKSVKF
ncbi:uncharacterized protein N7482_005569 [Penicillium canariense]|uniref:Sas10 C-terminal domain-containing protein n=1 Tax=Penicillium canariense TaxID=189055 RepID=A0A9W9I4Q1_9EURO|nr:uncharacterized protein N7482_005569 [Penicillium canariense]KAJ5166788.1 hypothetical protein N7482_005569 [Penicillium canariense]